MKKKDEIRPRNFVKKFADEFCKPSRFKDRKNDYDRRSRHERHWYEEDSPLPQSSRKSEREKRLRPNKDRSRDYERELDSEYWMEPEEDPSDSSEV
jgi:hypothetical protein